VLSGSVLDAVTVEDQHSECTPYGLDTGVDEIGAMAFVRFRAVIIGQFISTGMPFRFCQPVKLAKVAT
jgi:hypothetical protein